MTTKDRIEVVIENLGQRGDGRTADGLIVPRTLPGETVSLPDGDEAVKDMRVVDPSPERVAPVCRHFKTCGGCHLQHGSDRFVADWKAAVNQVVKERTNREKIAKRASAAQQPAVSYYVADNVISISRVDTASGMTVDAPLCNFNVRITAGWLG